MTATTYHESGHAVIAHLLGCPMQGVELDPLSRPESAGVAWEGEEVQALAPEARMACLMAGEGAAAMATNEHQWRLSESDVRAAAQVALASYESPDLARAMVVASYFGAVVMLERPGIWAAVTAVANALTLNRYLMADELATIIDAAIEDTGYRVPCRHPTTYIGEREHIEALSGILPGWER